MVQLEISVVLRQAAFFSTKHVLYILHPWHNVTLRSSINRKQYITTLSVAGRCSWAATPLTHCLIRSLLDIFFLTCNGQSCRKYSCFETTIFSVCLLAPKILFLPPLQSSTNQFFFQNCWHIFKLCALHSKLLYYVSLLIPRHPPPKFLSSFSMQRHISGFLQSLSPQASQGNIHISSSCVLIGK